MEEEILDSLSTTHPISAQAIKASITTDITIKDLLPHLEAMCEVGLITMKGKRYLKIERSNREAKRAT